MIEVLTSGNLLKYKRQIVEKWRDYCDGKIIVFINFNLDAFSVFVLYSKDRANKVKAVTAFTGSLTEFRMLKKISCSVVLLGQIPFVQAFHPLSQVMQEGWYILSGTKKDCEKSLLKLIEEQKL